MNLRPKKDSKGRYYIRPYVGAGNRPYKLLEDTPGTLTLQEAKKAAEAFVESLKPVVVAPGTKPTISAVFHLYLEINATSLAERSKKATLAYLPKFTAYFGDVAAESLTPLDIERYKAFRLSQKGYMGKKTQNSTVNREVAVLQACLAKAYQMGFLKGNPLGGRTVKRLVNTKKLDFFDRDEWQTFISGFSDRDKVLASTGSFAVKHSPAIREAYVFNMARVAQVFQVLLMTTSRLSEMTDLRWTALNFKSNRIAIYMGKTKATKHQDMTPELKALLEKLYKETPDKSGYVFTRKDGSQFTDHYLEESFKMGLKMAGNTRHLTPHSIRHTACSWLAMAGVPLHMIKEIAGHKNINSTMIYAHLMPSSLNPALSLLTGGSEKAANGTANGTTFMVAK